MTDELQEPDGGEMWNTISPEAAAILIAKLPVTSAERINFEWARTNWLKPKALPENTPKQAAAVINKGFARAFDMKL